MPKTKIIPNHPLQNYYGRQDRQRTLIWFKPTGSSFHIVKLNLIDGQVISNKQAFSFFLLSIELKSY